MSNYDKNKAGGLTIYISNLRYNFDSKGLEALFAKFGKVRYVKIMKQAGSDRGTGAAFVDMQNKADAMRAINYLNEKEVGGRVIHVSIAHDNKEEVKKHNKKIFSEKGRGHNKEEIILKKKSRRIRGLKALLKK